MRIPWVVWEADVTPGDYGENTAKRCSSRITNSLIHWLKLRRGITPVYAWRTFQTPWGKAGDVPSG